jgi:RNA polymerase sigma factor (sigma-70 family)
MNGEQRGRRRCKQGMSTVTVPLESLLANAGWARRLAAGLVRGDDVDDVIQDAWAAALRRPPDGKLPPRPWLKAVLSNLVRNRSRQDRRRRAREEAAGELAAEGPGPEALVARFEAHNLLARAVSELPETHRAVVLLRYYEMQTSSETARVLGIPAGTVRRRLMEALAMLRERLAGKDGADWQRAPLALLPSPSPLRGAPIAGLASLLAGGVVAVVVWQGHAGHGAVAVRPDPPARRDLPPPKLAPAPPSPSPAAPTSEFPPALVACRARAGTLRQEVALSDVEVWKHAGTEHLFERGEPNPAAEAELRAMLEPILRAGRAETPPFTLECRTWACRLTVLEPDEDAARKSWVRNFRNHEALEGRTRSVGFRGGPRETRDALTGATLWEVESLIALAAPSGERVAAPTPPSPAHDRTPLPAMLADCRDLVERLGDRLREQGARVERDMRPQGRYELGAPNAALEAEMARNLATVFGPGASAVEFSCRGPACRLHGAVLFDGNNVVPPLVRYLEAGVEKRRQNVPREQTIYVQLR